MSYDPLAQVVDAPLNVDAAVIAKLQAFRERPKLRHLPGVDPAEERERLSGILNDLADRLLSGIRSNPSKLWVMAQFQQSLKPVVPEDTEGREHFGGELEELMDILGIESSNGLLRFYLGF